MKRAGAECAVLLPPTMGEEFVGAMEFERVGGIKTLRTDARVVAATNRNLEEAARDGKFRPDLRFRLNVFPIRIPAIAALLCPIAPHPMRPSGLDIPPVFPS